MHASGNNEWSTTLNGMHLPYYYANAVFNSEAANVNPNVSASKCQYHFTHQFPLILMVIPQNFSQFHVIAAHRPPYASPTSLYRKCCQSHL